MNSNKRKYLPDKAFFENEYIKKGIPINEIAKGLGYDYRVVWQKIMRLNILKRKGNRRLELTGKKFGSLYVVALSKTKGKTEWVCRCVCGHVGVYPGHRLTGGIRKSCGCKNEKKPYGKKNSLWAGHGEISGSIWSKIKWCAKQQKREITITIQQAWDLFLEQDRKCAISGVKLTFGSQYSKHETTASLDRIDSSRGYIPENIQWVHKIINRMKTDLPQEVFLYWCLEIANGLSKKYRLEAIK